MCGIVGYVGPRQSVPILMDGLARLEYRGYDSAGVAYLQDSEITVQKQKGKLNKLNKVINETEINSTLGIGHTRWATHGVPDQINAHPHTDCNNRLALVHNGIVENYASLKRELEKQGHSFRSQTDTETLVHLIEENWTGSLEESVSKALKKVIGAYGIAVISRDDPNKIVVARAGSPIVVGVGEGEYFVGSDTAALVKYTREVFYLEDGQMAVITPEEAKTYDVQYTNEVEADKHTIPYDLKQIEKSGYPHFMLKEIHEQPDTLRDSMRGRLLPEKANVRLGGIADVLEDIENADQIYLTACGTSWHAALIGEYLIEEFVRTPVEVEYASEFRYRNPIITPDTVVIAISQSGETADTLGALRIAKEHGALCLGICNVVGSTISRETSAGVYIHAGPEIGVASTKAFTGQVSVLTLLTVLLGRRDGLNRSNGERIVRELSNLPQKAEQILGNTDQIEAIAKEFSDRRNFLYLGRGYNYPVALEGALKLKEISYIHAEGYPAAEMKHGPIALIDEEMPVVFIATNDKNYDKVQSNMEEVKARGGHIIAVATEGDTEIKNLADHVIYIPDTEHFLTPILTSIPLQLLAYYIAVERDCDVDQPRNLAKSVTVE
ncbi:MAG: glutamine--fructose-6-phosphate transaminase (isomerizing) [Candidatus Marinimicrobia bacterium]|nr:glutamine--fructose-6-phosphate transaminase (isomerizing) [Candidatus Neomarinimicrobiota bacterium]MCF7829815.1 glutamine--fructose-6-phosphate transaminase (isomerizing) [Candidatus Neomarinimicrobiota bacterium]MCF7881752.1 glutamine--fructose-6-phosphate transaminase (isomerizing) [Candidatus Neomarinimicrobiota bacterium]